MALRIASAATGVLRDAHMVLNPVTGLFEVSTLLEGPATNLALGACSFADGTHWFGSGDFTISAATSMLVGQTAYRHINNNLVASRSRSQIVGVFVSGQTDVYSRIIENDATLPAVTTALSIFDNTVNAHLHQVTFTWSTKAIATTTGSGTSGVQDLGGGRYRIWVSATGTASGTGAAGNTRRVYVYPTGPTQNDRASILHHAQFEAAASVPSSPIVTVAAAVTRNVDNAYYLGSALAADHAVNLPQACAGYVKFIVGSTPSGGCIWQISGSTGTVNPRLIVQYGSAAGACRIYHHNGTTAGQSDAGGVTTGQLVELLPLLYGDGSVEMLQRVDNGTVTSGGRSAAVALAGAWATPSRMMVGSINGTNTANTAYLRNGNAEEVTMIRGEVAGATITEKVNYAALAHTG